MVASISSSNSNDIQLNCFALKSRETFEIEGQENFTLDEYIQKQTGGYKSYADLISALNHSVSARKTVTDSGKIESLKYELSNFVDKF